MIRPFLAQRKWLRAGHLLLPLLLLLYLAFRASHQWWLLQIGLGLITLAMPVTVVQVLRQCLTGAGFRLRLFLFNVLGTCLLIWAGNRYCNREYITVQNASAEIIPEVRFSCNGAGKEIRKLQPGAKKTVFLQPGRHHLLLLKVELRKGPLVRSQLLKEEGNGLLTKSRVLIDSNFNWVVLPEKTVETKGPGQTLETSGGQLHYRLLAQPGAPTLLLLHGRSFAGDQYLEAAEALHQKGYQVVLPDLLGYGYSAAPNELDQYQPRRQALRLQALLQQLQIDSCHLVLAASALAWAGELLQEAPECIARMTVLDFGTAGLLPPWQLRNSALSGKLLAAALPHPLSGRPAFRLGLGRIDGQAYGRWTSGQAFFYWLCNGDFLKARAAGYCAALQRFSGPVQIIGRSNAAEGKAEACALAEAGSFVEVQDTAAWWAHFSPPFVPKKDAAQ